MHWEQRLSFKEMSLVYTILTQKLFFPRQV